MGEKLDFNGRTQLYFQLYDILYRAIKNGFYKPEELLPTENDLIEKYSVSRATVRKAMDLLVNDGLITRQRGYGTVVQKPKIEQTLNRVNHFSSEMARKGYNSSTTILENKIVYANKTIAEALDIKESTKMIQVKRLRSANENPMCIESAYLIYDKCPKVLEQDFSKNSLREFLVKEYNINWKKAVQKIYAINADSKLAKPLKIKAGDPLIYVERVSYDQNDQPGEYLQVYYRGDSYYFTAELVASSI
ncbi:MAG: GntR family transcriptional regulator [Firmicutes bacterium]|nr:GntR family transcriptional regulator [Bacillota bacterium]